MTDLLLFKTPDPDTGWNREFEGGSVVAGACFGSTGGMDGAAEAPFGSCKEGDTVVAGDCSGCTGGLSDGAEGTLRSCREGRPVVVGM
jgi:hypothetical protein